MTVTWEQLNLPPGLQADVKDLWSRKLTKKVRTSYTGTVASHGVIMVRISPQP
jgi:alpha-galactosidase